MYIYLLYTSIYISNCISILYRDFITADILKKELGMAVESAESHISFGKFVKKHPKNERTSFLDTIVEQSSFFSRSNTTTTSISKSHLKQDNQEGEKENVVSSPGSQSVNILTSIDEK